MADASQLRRGQKVTVHVRGKEKTAIVRKIPPYTETVMGEEREVTDKAMVQYPNTSIDGGNFFADISEAIPLEDIEV